MISAWTEIHKHVENGNSERPREKSQKVCNIQNPDFEEEFEDTKGVIRIRKSKERQHNGQKKKDKRTNNDLQNTTQKTEDQATRSPKVKIRYKVHITKFINFYPSYTGDLVWFLLSCLGLLALLLPNILKLFGFPIFRIWAYLMKVFPETRCAH